MSTFNGWTIYTLPAFPAAPRSVEWNFIDTVGDSTSPFSGQQQIYDWSASWIEGSITYQKMKDADARAFTAFLKSLHGIAGVFSFGDPLRSKPRGSGAGSPEVSGSGQTGYALNVKGLTPSASGVLLPGDQFSLGLRLYENLGTVNADGSGNATLSIWPQIREPPADGTALVLTNPSGLFRLKSNTRKVSYDETKLYAITFEVREAL